MQGHQSLKNPQDVHLGIFQSGQVVFAAPAVLLIRRAILLRLVLTAPLICPLQGC